MDTLSSQYIELTKAGVANQKYLHTLESGLPNSFMRWTGIYALPISLLCDSQLTPQQIVRNNEIKNTKKGSYVIFSQEKQKIMTYTINIDEDNKNSIKTEIQ